MDIGKFQGRDIIVQFGLTATPASFQASIKRFLGAYLGNDETPVPFGGRDEQITTLNQWLFDPDAPGNLLITAPAGRGKTALLVRWVDQLPACLPIAFIPISIRYQTNRASIFYQALAARLAAILGEVLPPTPSDPASFYKEKVIEFLDRFEGAGSRCLVVLDGLDEASGWQVDTSVLPPRPPRGLKIVASARQLAGDRGAQDWLRRLGWATPRSEARTLEVPPLQRKGISEVLKSMGVPIDHLAKDVDLVGELYRLTEEGDPLLLELYVTDLWNRGEALARFRPSDLKSLKPGFGAYFRDWLDQQRTVWTDSNRRFDKAEVDAILALLSCALGPISLAALGQVLPQVHEAKTFVTKDTLDPIGRFVVGDGVESGYVLGHPKLAEFLREEYFGGSQIVQACRQAFVTWGRQVIRDVTSGLTAPEQIPEYCLLYYAQHLQTAHPLPSLEVYRELVEDTWRKAWLAHPDGLRGFARDIEVVFLRLREAARQDRRLLKAPRVGLGGLIRCAVCLSSIRSIGAAVPPNFIAELVRSHLIGPKQALHMSHQKPEAEQSATLVALATVLPLELLDEAVLSARGLADPEHQALALAALGSRFKEPLQGELMDEALQVAERCDPANNHRLAVTTAIQRYRSSPAQNEALADRTRSDARTVRIRDSLIQEDLEPSDAPLPDDWRRAALDALELHRYGALQRLAPKMEAEAITEVFAAAFKKSEYQGLKVLVILAPHMPAEVRSNVLLDVVKWPVFVDDALALLAPHASDEQLGQMLAALNELQDYMRPRVLKSFVAYLSPELLRSAVQTVLAWDSAYAVHESLAVLVPRLSPVLLQEAADHVIQLSNRYLRRMALKEVAPFLPSDAVIKMATTLSEDLSDLDQLLPELSEDLRCSVVTATYKGTMRIGDQVALAAAYTALAWRLDGRDARDALELACSTARAVDDDQQRAISLLLVSFSTGLGVKKAREVVHEGLDALARLEGPSLKALPLSLFALSRRLTVIEATSAVQGALEFSKDDTDLSSLCAALLLHSPWVGDEHWARLAREVIGGKQEHNRDESADQPLWVLVALLPRLRNEELQRYFNEVMVKVRTRELEDDVVFRTLIALSPHLGNKEAEMLLNQVLVRRNAEYGAITAAMAAPYLQDATLDMAVDVLLDRIVGVSREEVLAIISLAEGKWGDVLAIQPGIAGGKGSRSMLERAGGRSAVSETYLAISDAQSWWP